MKEEKRQKKDKEKNKEDNDEKGKIPKKRKLHWIFSQRG